MLRNLTWCFQIHHLFYFVCLRCDYWFLVRMYTVRLFALQKSDFYFAPGFRVLYCVYCRGHGNVKASFVTYRSHSFVAPRMSFFGLQRSHSSLLIRIWKEISANFLFLVRKCTFRALYLPWIYHILVGSFFLASTCTVYWSACRLFNCLAFCH